MSDPEQEMKQIAYYGPMALYVASGFMLLMCMLSLLFPFGADGTITSTQLILSRFLAGAFALAACVMSTLIWFAIMEHRKETGRY